MCIRDSLHPHHKQSNDNFYPPSCLDVCHHGMDSRQHHFCGYEVHNFPPPVLWLAALLLLKICSNHKFLLSCGESLCYNKFVAVSYTNLFTSQTCSHSTLKTSFLPNHSSSQWLFILLHINDGVHTSALALVRSCCCSLFFSTLGCISYCVNPFKISSVICSVSLIGVDVYKRQVVVRDFAIKSHSSRRRTTGSFLQ